jgi:serine/threonine-protein kinase RsbW
MRDEAHFSLTVAAEPANVAVVREAVEGRAAELGMGETAIADLKTVVSEACANVVLHAYAGDADPGLLEIELLPEGRALSVVIRDRGAGIDVRPAAGKSSSLRLGLALIGALSSSFQLRSARGEGTELTIQVPLGATT